MLSPSIIVIRRLRSPTLRAVALAATASVGEVNAPSTKATGHESPTTAWATAATTMVVTSTSPTESSKTGRREKNRSIIAIEKFS